jgi:hypothetical protein
MTGNDTRAAKCRDIDFRLTGFVAVTLFKNRPHRAPRLTPSVWRKEDSCR